VRDSEDREAEPADRVAAAARVGAAARIAAGACGKRGRPRAVVVEASESVREAVDRAVEDQAEGLAQARVEGLAGEVGPAAEGELVSVAAGLGEALDLAGEEPGVVEPQGCRNPGNG
jgi:hypothetical protein